MAWQFICEGPTSTKSSVSTIPLPSPCWLRSVCSPCLIVLEPLLPRLRAGGEGKTQSLIGFPLQMAGAPHWLRTRLKPEWGSREGDGLVQAQLGAILLSLGLREERGFRGICQALWTMVTEGTREWQSLRMFSALEDGDTTWVISLRDNSIDWVCFSITWKTPQRFFEWDCPLESRTRKPDFI